MKLKFISLLMFAMLASNAMASLVATLYHEGNVQMFYTSTALAEAVKVAQSGDLICLSSGTFNSPDTIKKAVSIRGTSVKYWTKVETISYNIPDEDSASFTVECVSIKTLTLTGNMEKALLIKDSIKTLTMQTCTKSNIFARNCYVAAFYKANGVNASFVNCFINAEYNSYFSNFRSYAPQTIFVNCLVSITNASKYNTYYISEAIFYNCLITGWTGMAASIEKYNCLLYYYKISGSGNIDSSKGDDNSDLNLSDFVSVNMGKGNYDYRSILSANYVLSDSIRTTKLGADGTEIGLYGGAYPYTLEPSYPVITNMKVAGKVTADEKLSVDIEVHTQQ